MKLLISQLPRTPWRGDGIHSYDDNPAMRLGAKPDQGLLEKERSNLISVFSERNIEVIELPFPEEFDQGPLNHDFVFIRDPFITNQKGKALILKMKEQKRKIEKNLVADILKDLSLEIVQLPDKQEMYAEGGEFYFCPTDNILFSGQGRNSVSGTEAVAEFLYVNELVIIQSDAFHLDTFFTPVFNPTCKICALIICMEIVSTESTRTLMEFTKKRDIPIIDIQIEDALGTPLHPGSFAANSLPLPGLLFSSNEFLDHTINARLAKMDVQQIIVPATQFGLSGGSIHCITNEI